MNPVWQGRKSGQAPVGIVDRLLRRIPVFEHDHRHAGRTRRENIGARVADHQAIAGFTTGIARQPQQGRGVGFARGQRVPTEPGTKTWGQAQGHQQRLDVAMRLVGAHRQFGALLRQRVEGFEGPRIDARLQAQAVAIVPHETLELALRQHGGVGPSGPGQRRAEQLPCAVTDPGTDARLAGRRQAEFFQRAAHGLGQIRRGVDQGAVQVEYDQCRFFHAASSLPTR